MGKNSNDYEGAFTNPTGTQQAQQNTTAAQSSGGNGVPFDAERSYNNLLKTVASDKKKLQDEIDGLKKEIESLKGFKKSIEDDNNKLENKIQEIRTDLDKSVVSKKPTLFLVTRLDNGDLIKAEKPKKPEEVETAKAMLVAKANNSDFRSTGNIPKERNVVDLFYYKYSNGKVEETPLTPDELIEEGLL